MRWLVMAAPLLLFTSVAAAESDPVDGAAAASEDDDAAASEPADELGYAVLGAEGPAFGDFVLQVWLGAALILPHLTLQGRAGLGGGVFIEAGYRNLGVFGQQARGQLGWGGRIADGIDFGVTARTRYSTLELADGDVVGIQFSALPIGNDWEVGNDIVVTFERPGHAHITASLGPTFTLGGIRYVGFEQQADGFSFDPSIRALELAIQSEWGFWEQTNFFLRLDAMILLGQETDEACEQAGRDNCGRFIPYGFIPTGSLGLAWAP